MGDPEKKEVDNKATDDSAAAAGLFPEDNEANKKAASTSEGTKSFAEQVNEAVGTMKEGDDGIWVLPENSDVPEEVQFAAGLEKRRRDTQSNLAKTKQQLKASSTENVGILKLLEKSVKPKLTVEELEELEDLKTSDPDAWRVKLNEHDNNAKAEHQKELDTIKTTASEGSEEVRRTQVLADFLDDNPGLILNDEVLENDLPPRITSKLENGEHTFEEFLDNVKKFLTATKVIANSEELEKEPDLSEAGGGSAVSDVAIQKDAAESYEKEIY